ncbi:MAG: hypothetical protein ABW100_06880 [Candidatus Thiodiazotropha sp. 6PLUC3]
MNWFALQSEILLPAFLAGLIVAATHVPLGRHVLKRGIIFLDLAVAQTAGMGLIIAHGFGWEPGGWQVQMIAVTAAITASLLLYLTDKRWAEIQEALIGSLFVLTSSGSILLLAANPHGGEHLKELSDCGCGICIGIAPCRPMGHACGCYDCLHFGTNLITGWLAD